jgi:hypothetical protein
MRPGCWKRNDGGWEGLEEKENKALRREGEEVERSLGGVLLEINNPNTRSV